MASWSAVKYGKQKIELIPRLMPEESLVKRFKKKKGAIVLSAKKNTCLPHRAVYTN